MRLIDDWKRAHKLWTVQAAFALALANGFVIGLQAFLGMMNPWLFMGLNVVGYLSIAGLRLVKQSKGAQDADPLEGAA